MNDWKYGVKGNQIMFKLLGVWVNLVQVDVCLFRVWEKQEVISRALEFLISGGDWLKKSESRTKLESVTSTIALGNNRRKSRKYGTDH